MGYIGFRIVGGVEVFESVGRDYVPLLIGKLLLLGPPRSLADGQVWCADRVQG